MSLMCEFRSLSRPELLLWICRVAETILEAKSRNWQAAVTIASALNGSMVHCE